MLLYKMSNVRFGSLAVVQHHISRTAAFGRIADHQNAEKLILESPMEADSGHWPIHFRNAIG
jgi:hypothetical protein